MYRLVSQTGHILDEYDSYRRAYTHKKRQEQAGCVCHIVNTNAGRRGNFKPKTQDITGKRFGRLTVLGLVGTTDGKHFTLWRVRCDCGTEFIAYGNNLRSGMTRSCGCLRTDTLRARKATTEQIKTIINNKAL